MSRTVVSLVNQGMQFWLKGTTFTSSLERAQRFETTDEARAAIQRASKFHKTSTMKRCELWSEDMAAKEVQS